MGVLPPLESEEKVNYSPKIPDGQVDNPLRRTFHFYAYSIFFLYLFNSYSRLLVMHFPIDVIHCKLCRKPSVRLFVIIAIFSWYQSREMYDSASSPIIVKTEQYLRMLHIMLNEVIVNFG